MGASGQELRVLLARRSSVAARILVE